MTSPLLSVVTPSYNQAEFLHDNIQSILQQSHDDVEHIVVDGESTDTTLDILREYESEYNLRWVSEPDRGQSHALNKGIEMARGEWIGWLNVDDYYLPGAFDALRTALDTRDRPDVVYGDLLFVDRDGNELSRRYHTTPSMFVQRHWTLSTANHCSFFRADLFDRVGTFDESKSYTMDEDFFWRLLRNDVRWAHVPALLGARRMHKAAKTNVDRTVMLEEMQREAPHIERFIPDPALCLAAVGLKSAQILAEGVDPMTEATISWSLEALRHELSRPVIKRL